MNSTVSDLGLNIEFLEQYNKEGQAILDNTISRRLLSGELLKEYMAQRELALKQVDEMQ